ncbi:MAG: transporter substrate-binding domain-containing protein, partial [Lachnospiraceae bacterium]
MKKSMKKVFAFGFTCIMAAASLTACGSSNAAPAEPAKENTTTGAAANTDEKKVLKVAMECGYAPYNWTQPDDSNGAVQISGSKDYAYG